MKVSASTPPASIDDLSEIGLRELIRGATLLYAIRQHDLNLARWKELQAVADAAFAAYQTASEAEHARLALFVSTPTPRARRQELAREVEREAIRTRPNRAWNAYMRARDREAEFYQQHLALPKEGDDTP